MILMRLSLLAKKVGQRKRIVESAKQVGKAQAAAVGLILALAAVQQDESGRRGAQQQQQGNLRDTKYTRHERIIGRGHT